MEQLIVFTVKKELFDLFHTTETSYIWLLNFGGIYRLSLIGVAIIVWLLILNIGICVFPFAIVISWPSMYGDMLGFLLLGGYEKCGKFFL